MNQKTISVIAPSSWIKEEYLTSTIRFLSKAGFKVKCTKQVYAIENSYTAGTDMERVKALHDAFNDKNTDIILCAKGGHSNRIYELLYVSRSFLWKDLSVR